MKQRFHCWTVCSSKLCLRYCGQSAQCWADQMTSERAAPQRRGCEGEEWPHRTHIADIRRPQPRHASGVLGFGQSITWPTMRRYAIQRWRSLAAPTGTWRRCWLARRPRGQLDCLLESFGRAREFSQRIVLRSWVRLWGSWRENGGIFTDQEI